jgi:hypothetical protein
MLGHNQVEHASRRIKQLCREIPKLAGFISIPVGIGTVFWLSLTNDR